FLRAGDALAAGFKAGFGVPVVAGEEVAAVMVFFMAEAGDDDARLIELVSTAAIHLGTVIRRRLSECAREEIKRRYEELINNIAAGIYRSVPGEGRFIEANRAFVDMMGAQSKEELLKQDPAVFYQDKGKMKEINEKLSSGGFIKNLEVELVTLQGRRIWVSTSVVMKRDREGKIYCDGIVEDITGRKRLEEQLIHSQRMEAVGQLAAGIAHDFNNILTAIIGYANLLAMKTQGEPSKGFVDHIRALSERAAALVAGLMAFGRKQPVRLQALDLNSAVRSAQNIFARVIGEHIALKAFFSKKELAVMADPVQIEQVLMNLATNAKNIFARVIGEHIALKAFFSKKELAVMADPVQIEQVLMNLATNARDAMPGGGTLSIATAMAGPDDEFLSLRGVFQPRGYALITFTDTGRGMDEETRKRIFEPFFTTKETGKGTGASRAGGAPS
ncbi:MAG: PAS domain S-box protein, partial [Deltaproteobacteria bacterium]|nr:PAS domain S-box protein [Deltaproteobacteria bacterium]